MWAVIKCFNLVLTKLIKWQPRSLHCWVVWT